MDIKMICIDMDGTLLNKRKKVSNYSKNIIQKAHDKGIEIVVTTGRIYNNAEYFSHILGVKSPVIGSNGAIVRDKINDKVIYEKDMPKRVTIDVIRIMKECGVVFHIYTTDEIFCSNKIIQLATKLLILKQTEHQHLKIKYNYMKNDKEVEDVISNNEGRITKCIAFSLNKNKIIKLRERLSELDSIVCYGAGALSLEVNAKGVSKGNAVKALAEYNGIKAENVMCIGDNENDISMLKYAGMGVAMGNAIDKVKEVADYITDTNIEDGVAKAIEKLVIKDS